MEVQVTFDDHIGRCIVHLCTRNFSPRNSFQTEQKRKNWLIGNNFPYYWTAFSSGWSNKPLTSTTREPSVSTPPLMSWNTTVDRALWKWVSTSQGVIIARRFTAHTPYNGCYVFFGVWSEVSSLAEELAVGCDEQTKCNHHQPSTGIGVFLLLKIINVQIDIETDGKQCSKYHSVFYLWTPGWRRFRLKIELLGDVIRDDLVQWQSEHKDVRRK